MIIFDKNNIKRHKYTPYDFNPLHHVENSFSRQLSPVGKEESLWTGSEKRSRYGFFKYKRDLESFILEIDKCEIITWCYRPPGNKAIEICPGKHKDHSPFLLLKKDNLFRILELSETSVKMVTKWYDEKNLKLPKHHRAKMWDELQHYLFPKKFDELLK